MRGAGTRVVVHQAGSFLAFSSSSLRCSRAFRSTSLSRVSGSIFSRASLSQKKGGIFSRSGAASVEKMRKLTTIKGSGRVARVGFRIETPADSEHYQLESAMLRSRRAGLKIFYFRRLSLLSPSPDLLANQRRLEVKHKSTILLSLILVAFSIEPARSQHQTIPQEPKWIIGGEPVPRERFPSVVRIDGNGWFCTGSFVAKKWVLTAAHCVRDHGTPISPESITVIEGEDRGSNVKQVIIHPQYYSGGAGFRYDAALLEMIDSFDSEAEGIVPVRLLTPEERALYAPSGTLATAVGYGRKENDEWSYSLRYVDIPLSLPEDCRRDYSFLHEEEIAHDFTLCAGAPGKGVNSGDSGGPLLVRVGEARGQVGIASIRGRSSSGEPVVSVYTRVPSIYDWIQANVLGETVLVGTFFNGNTDFLHSRAYLWNPSDVDAGIVARAYTMPRSGPSILLGAVNLGLLNAKSGRNIKIAEDILVTLNILLPYVDNGGNLIVEFTVAADGVIGTGQVFGSGLAFGTYPLEVPGP